MFCRHLLVKCLTVTPLKFDQSKLQLSAASFHTGQQQWKKQQLASGDGDDGGRGAGATDPKKATSTVRWAKRPPVVTIMGHVDHGKTTLLDYLRSSEIVKSEFGGITQHIGAFVVPFKPARAAAGPTELVTFLDTPGHAAFAAMRRRGASMTDMVVLVVAAEDGVLDQTAESISYAKASQVPLIVAVNKVDKIGDRRQLEALLGAIRSQLRALDVITELDGGEVQVVEISALKGSGIEDLKEAILALAETLELVAPAEGPVSGRVIESRVDSHRGKLCTVLVQAGLLKKGSYLVSGGSNWARARALFDERGLLRQSCPAGQPVQVSGWRTGELPAAGEPIREVNSELEARRIVGEHQRHRSQLRALEDGREAQARAEQHTVEYRKLLEAKRASGRRYGRVLMAAPPPAGPQAGQGEPKINLVLKCDVNGSLEALLNLLDTYEPSDGRRQPVKLDVMHYGVGDITEGDLVLASSFPDSLVYGFNVGAGQQRLLAEARRLGVEVRLFRVIYQLIDDLKARLADRMPEVERETEVGRALVLQQFVLDGQKRARAQHVAGCRCTWGELRREAHFRLLRQNQLVADGLRVRSLRQLREDVRLVAREQECGLAFADEHQQLQFQPGDQLVAYERCRHKAKLKWDLKGFA